MITKIDWSYVTCTLSLSLSLHRRRPYLRSFWTSPISAYSDTARVSSVRPPIPRANVWSQEAHRERDPRRRPVPDTKQGLIQGPPSLSTSHVSVSPSLMSFFWAMAISGTHPFFFTLHGVRVILSFLGFWFFLPPPFFLRSPNVFLWMSPASSAPVVKQMFFLSFWGCT